MSQMIQAPKMPVIAAAPPPPAVDAAMQAQDQERILKTRRGRASTILNSPGAPASKPSVGVKTLLGQ